MTPLTKASDIQNYAFFIELPVDNLISENEEIQTLQIDGSSPLMTSNINSAVQPIIIASTDSEGNCFVTLQDEDHLNSSSSWVDPNEIAVQDSITEIIIPSITTQQRAVLSTATVSSVIPTESVISSSKNVEARTNAEIASASLTTMTNSAASRTKVTLRGKTTPAKKKSVTFHLNPVTNTTKLSHVPKVMKKGSNGIVSHTSNMNEDADLQQATRVSLPLSFFKKGEGSLMRYRRTSIFDNLKCIPVTEFKSQLTDTSDITGRFDLAPPTRRFMNLLQWKGIASLFASPGQAIMSVKLMKLFTRHLRTKLVDSNVTFPDMELLPLGYKPTVDPTKIKRITRRRRYPEAEEYQRRMIEEQMQKTMQDIVANGHSDIQNVFLDNAGAMRDELSDSTHILIESMNNETYAKNDANKVAGMFDNTNDDSIIVIHNGQETDQASEYSHQNLEVLLAAAGDNGLSPDGIHQVIICSTENDDESVLPYGSSIIIVPNDSLDTITETVV